MNGMRIRLETKPGKSRASAGVFPRSRASSTIAADVSSDVSSVRITSTSWSTGTGLKKCIPITLSGRPVAAASEAMGIDDVFEASTASGGSTASARSNSSRLTSTSSTTASIMRSAGTTSSTGVTRARTSSGSAPPFSASFARLRAIPSSARSTAPGCESWSETSLPEAATTCAIPAPIWPAPTTRTCGKDFAAATGGV